MFELLLFSHHRHDTPHDQRRESNLRQIIEELTEGFLTQLLPLLGFLVFLLLFRKVSHTLFRFSSQS